MNEKVEKLVSQIDKVSSLESSLVQDEDGSFKDDELQQLKADIQSTAQKNRKNLEKIVEDQKQKAKDDEERKTAGDNAPIFKKERTAQEKSDMDAFLKGM